MTARERFGEHLKTLRIERGLTLRAFCRASGSLDPANVSKIERGLNAPSKNIWPYAKALGLKLRKLRDFMDLAHLARSELPPDICSDEKLMEYMPLFLRSMRLSPDKLKALEVIVRAANSPDS